MALGANGGPLTWEAIIDAELSLVESDAGSPPFGWAMSPRSQRHAKTTPRITGQPIYLQDEFNTIEGSTGLATTALPDNLTKGTAVDRLGSAVVGNFAAGMTIATWGPGAELIFNCFDFDVAGVNRLSAHLLADVAIRRPECFRKFNDIDTSVS